MPPPLEGWKHKVLLAGKYLNVVREWGGDAAGVRNSLKELENKGSKEEGQGQGGDGKEETEHGAPRPSNLKSKSGSSDKAKTRDSTLNDKGSAESDDGAMDSPTFYKAVEDAYTYANRTLLRVLMEDQMLIPRLR